MDSWRYLIVSASVIFYGFLFLLKNYKSSTEIHIGNYDVVYI